MAVPGKMPAFQQALPLMALPQPQRIWRQQAGRQLLQLHIEYCPTCVDSLRRLL